MIKKLTSNDIDQVANLHHRELPGFLSDLGLDFLREFYKVALSIPEIFTLVEKRNEQILGFISGTVSTKGLYKKIFLKSPFRFTAILLRYFITHIYRFQKILSILTYPGFLDDNPEILTITVSKKHRRKKIGTRLLKSAAAEFKKRGVDEFKIGVYERLSANLFYQKIGCRKIATFDFLGEKMNYYQYSSKRKLRLILLTYDSLYANPIFLPLLDKDFLEIALVVVSGCIVYGKSTWQSLLFFWKKHGLKYFVFKIIDQCLYIFTNWINWLDSGKTINKVKRFLPEAKTRQIPTVKIKDINDKKSLEILRQYQPDIIVSYFNQILKKDALSVAKIGNLNVHPGFLPDFRGVASSFWARIKGSKYAGVTIHEMVEKLDSGDILAREKIYFQKGKSLHRNNFRCCQKGGLLLLQALKKIYKNRKIEGKKQGKGNYFSWPGKKDVENYLKAGNKLMKWEDLKLYW